MTIENNPPVKISKEEAIEAFRGKTQPTTMWEAFSELTPLYEQIHFNHEVLPGMWSIKASTIGGGLIYGEQYSSSKEALYALWSHTKMNL